MVVGDVVGVVGVVGVDVCVLVVVGSSVVDEEVVVTREVVVACVVAVASQKARPAFTFPSMTAFTAAFNAFEVHVHTSIAVHACGGRGRNR